MGAGDPVLQYGDVAVTEPAERAVEDLVTQGQLVALESQALSFGPKQLIDGMFGSGWYDKWQELSAETRDLRQRTVINENRYGEISGFGARSPLGWDLRTLDSLATDYDASMARASRGEPIDVEATKDLYTMYSLAIGVVEHDNDALDAAFVIGVVSLFIKVPFVLLRERALRLQELLKVLKAQLEQARQEVAEAWAQGLLDAAIAGISLFVPLGLVARGGILLAQGIFDTAMGPSTSTQATAGSHSSKAGEFASAVAEVRSATDRQRSIAKAGGATATVVGFVFDVNEIRVAYKNVDQLSQIMDQARAALAKLNADIAKHRPSLQRFVQDYETWQTSIASVRTQADLIRRALEEELRSKKYNVH